MTTREVKIWGSCAHIFHSEFAAVSHLEVNAGYQCSRHKHNLRANQFNVLSGEIIVEKWTYFDGKALPSTEVSLKAGDSCIVPAGIFHRFRVIESGEVIEVYWPQKPGWSVSLDDIVRLDEGGPCDT